MIIKTKIWLACGSDELRPVLNHVCFRNGFAYATDAHVCIKQSLCGVFEATAEESALLNEKLIDKAGIKLLYNKDIRVEYSENKEIFLVSIDGRLKVKLLDISVFGKFPNADAVMPSILNTQTCLSNECWLNSKLFSRAFDAMYFEDHGKAIKLFMSSHNRAVIIKALHVDESVQHVIVMPIEAKE